MTDEQIKQNAEAYSNGIDGSMCYPAINDTAYNAHIAGAHSRDEEIKELEQALSVAEDALDMQREKIDKLCNPWVSIENRLPKEDEENAGYSVNVIGLFEGGHINNCNCSIEENI